MTPVLPAGCVVALLGTDLAATNQLADALAERLARRGIISARVDSCLRQWHDRDDRAPGAHELVALAARHGDALTLLVAVDMPTAADDLLRAALAEANLPFAVVHGRDGGERLANAWNAILAAADPESRTNAASAGDGRPTAWSCDKCSDPACEHRLFSDLVARRR